MTGVKQLLWLFSSGFLSRRLTFWPEVAEQMFWEADVDEDLVKKICSSIRDMSKSDFTQCTTKEMAIDFMRVRCNMVADRDITYLDERREQMRTFGLIPKMKEVFDRYEKIF